MRSLRTEPTAKALPHLPGSTQLEKPRSIQKDPVAVGYQKQHESNANLDGSANGFCPFGPRKPNPEKLEPQEGKLKWVPGGIGAEAVEYTNWSNLGKNCNDIVDHIEEDNENNRIEMNGRKLDIEVGMDHKVVSVVLDHAVEGIDWGLVDAFVYQRSNP